MITGPIAQFKITETPNIFQAVATFPSSSYFTFASTGYIIQSNPTAIGRETVPNWTKLKRSTIPGRNPRRTPLPIARKIQRGRKRSKRESFPTTVSLMINGSFERIF